MLWGVERGGNENEGNAGIVDANTKMKVQVVREGTKLVDMHGKEREREKNYLERGRETVEIKKMRE